jgi:2,5-dichlorohydroquinone reductive dechlorinase
MADLYWAVELLRMTNVGAAAIWENGRLPSVAAFLAASEQIPAIRAAVLDWPGALY